MQRRCHGSCGPTRSGWSATDTSAVRSRATSLQAGGGGSRNASAPTAVNRFTRSPACKACPEWGRNRHERRCPHYGSASAGLAQELIGAKSAKRAVQQRLRCRTPRNSQLNITAGTTVAGQNCLSGARWLSTAHGLSRAGLPSLSTTIRNCNSIPGMVS